MVLPFQWVACGLGVGYLFVSGTVSWKGALGTVAVVASGLALLLYRFQEHLLYQPRIFPQHLTPKDNPPGMRHPGEHGLGWEDVRLKAADGTGLHAWLIRPENLADRRSRATLLFFHENAGNMGLRMENLKMMYEQLNVNVLILSYRGYGESEGVPEEEGIYQDAEAALQYVQSRTDLDTTRIVLFGRSLGGGVAIDLASKHERTGGVACIIVENTFASISAMVDVIFPALRWAKIAILRMRWESELKIATITRPILFLSGAQDEIVPASQMVRLHAAATSAIYKKLAVIPDGKHNDTWSPAVGGRRYLEEIRAFLSAHAAPGSSTQQQQRAAL